MRMVGCYRMRNVRDPAGPAIVTFARALCAAAYLVLVVSVIASALAFFSNGPGLFNYFVWVHLAIILLGWLAIGSVIKHKLYRADRARNFMARSKALLAASVLIIVVAACATRSVDIGLGRMADGTVIQQKGWFERDGKYWMTVNGRTPVEINQAQYRRLDGAMFAFFSLIWVITSCVLAYGWAYIAWSESERLAVGADAHA